MSVNTDREQTTMAGWKCSTCKMFVMDGSAHVCEAIEFAGPSMPSKTPHKCPACDGWGERHNKLFNVTCPACNGKGLVWES